MLQKYEKVCYQFLRPAQIKEIREQIPIAYIPAGSLEWHSFQNPLGTDSLKAHSICCEAALKYGGVVLPPFYQGLLGNDNWGPKGWDGYTLSFNENEMFYAAMLGICKALVYGKWKILVGVTGHDVGGHIDCMQKAIEQATDGKNSTGFAEMEGGLHKPNDEIPVTMDHAGAWETSCMMYAYPDKVDLNTLKERKLSSEEQMEMEGPEGIGGKNPLKYASSELGKKIIEKMGDLIGQKAKQMFESISRIKHD